MKQARFSQQKKQELVAYALSHPEITTRQLAKDMGVGHSTLDKWLRQARQVGAGAVRTLSAEQLRIQQLEQQVAHLREVNEIVKKAHVYFVTQPSRDGTRS
jgi:transposase-like protein